MLDNRVAKAKLGDEYEMTALLYDFGWRKNGNFKSFLGKYETMLWDGIIDLKDKDTRFFIQLYIKDPIIRKGLNRNYQPYASIKAAQEMIEFIQERVKDTIEKEELRQDLSLLFLNLINRYKKKKKEINFNGYLYNSYRYEVYRYLKKSIFNNDFLLMKNETLLDENIKDDTNVVYEKSLYDHFYDSEMSRDELGIFWINGRCGELFKQLDTFERIIIRDHDFLKMTDSEIAKRYGYHRNSIGKKRNKAYVKIKKEIK